MVEETRAVGINEKHLEELAKLAKKDDDTVSFSKQFASTLKEGPNEATLFCQTNTVGRGHKSRHFSNIEETRKWLAENGGGTMPRRNRKVISASGHGLGRVVFDPHLRVWGEIATVEGKG
jgi:hypothetical protein